MIIVSGSIKLRGNYEVKLDMTEEQFDRLSERQQNEEIENAVNWDEWIRNAELNDIDIDDLKEEE